MLQDRMIYDRMCVTNTKKTTVLPRIDYATLGLGFVLVYCIQHYLNPTLCHQQNNLVYITIIIFNSLFDVMPLKCTCIYLNITLHLSEREFDKKDVSEWVYKDLVQFIFFAYNSMDMDMDQDTFDFDFSKASDFVPPLKFEESLFKQISKNHGEVLYRYFQNFLECKREREAQAQRGEAISYVL